MLEIRNLVKVYKAKGGAEVRALDDVSVKFEEKGMVFLLGKSGSGKSTLLNLCGGLDAPDSGEIIIKGRSSKDFSQSDFDSYRNTFVGFVFQEYNILDEFTVEDNIALALELQGKNKNKEQVNAILEQVDLANFAKRKPNTLSGGQKQRVAIARALVKSPEIIMADEPTGALDSNTGKQVFETLKKLSAEKLVIVVSHDREFAEIYGDRIIELKDGKIISDVTKTKIAAVAASDNVSFVGNDTISIKSGSKLSASDIEKINRFLAASSEDVIITNGKKEISDFRKAARIDESGARETFKDTDEKQIAAKAYTPQDSRFIRSKLPVRHAIRIGASSMKVKPFRLLFTILLSFIAFTLFGLFSTLTFYDKTSTAVQTYLDAGYESLMLQKQYRVTSISYTNGEENYRYEYMRDTQYTPAELAEYREEYGAQTLGVFNYNNDSYGSDRTFTIRNVSSGSDFNSNYYNYQLKGFAEIGSGWNGDLLTNDTDLSALGEDDIILSSYTFDSIKAARLYSEDNTDSSLITLNTYDDIVGRKIYLAFDSYGETAELTVRGVYRCDLPSEYDSLKEQTGAQLSPDESQAFAAELDYGLYQYALVSADFYEAHSAQFSQGSEENRVDYGFSYLQQSVKLSPETADSEEDGNYYDSSFSQINSLPPSRGAVPTSLAYFDGRDVNSALSDGEIVLPFSSISQYVTGIIDNQRTDLYAQLEQANNDDNYELANQLQEQIAQLDIASKQLNMCTQCLSYGAYQTEEYDEETGEYYPVTHTPTEEEMQQCVEYVLSFIESFADTKYAMPTQLTLELPDIQQELGTYTLVGFYYGIMSNQNGNSAYFSANDFNSLLTTVNQNSETDSYYSEEVTKYVRPADARYNYIAISCPDSESGLRTLLSGENVVNGEDDTSFKVHSLISDQLGIVNNMIDTLWQIFLYVGIVLAAFAMLLLFNFISVSISNKKKEIGILRAVGARSTDVFKIFYSESVIITAICFVLAMIASFVVCGILNNTIKGMIGASIFVFGPLSWLVMLGIAVVTSVIATFLPVYSAAKRKPVESIRAL